MTEATKSSIEEAPSGKDGIAARLADILCAVEQQPVPDRLTKAALELQSALDAMQAARHAPQKPTDDNG